MIESLNNREPNLRARAYRITRAAIAAGRLVPQPCAGCGTTENIRAHHEDYAKPLQVTWMCHGCHMEYHAAEKADQRPGSIRKRSYTEYACLRCGHEWRAMFNRPAVCPKCKSYSWDEPPKRTVKRRQVAQEESHANPE